MILPSTSKARRHICDASADSEIRPFVLVM